MSAYLDTSCVLELLWPEAETAATVEMVRAEDHVVVSSLVWLETKVRIQARYASGSLTRAKATKLVAKAEELFETPPFERRGVPAVVFDEAARQVELRDRSSHCRTRDRLHLAAIRTLGLSRLITNDDAQARAARALGIEVLVPR